MEKWAGEKNAQKPGESLVFFFFSPSSRDGPLFLGSSVLSPGRVFETHLDAQLGVLRRAVGRVLTLARERCVVVVLPRHHPQHGFHGVQGAVVEQLLRRFDASVQHVPQAVDPRDLQRK